MQKGTWNGERGLSLITLKGHKIFVNLFMEEINIQKFASQTLMAVACNTEGEYYLSERG